MNRQQAARAALTLEDVFTPEGDAVTIAQTTPDGWEVRVNGTTCADQWMHINHLTAREDLNKIDFNARYTVRGYRGVAFYLKGYAQRFEPYTFLAVDDETGEDIDVPDPYGEGEYVDDYENVIAVMVGDDREHTVSVEDITRLDDEAYCHECGQVGCTHDGR